MKKTILLLATCAALSARAQVDYFDYAESIISTGSLTTNAVGVPLAKDGSNNVFYVDNFNALGLGKIHQLVNTSGSTWTNTLLNAAQAKVANGILYADFKIFFVASDNTIHNLYESTPGNWVDGSLGVSPTVLAGTNITRDPSGNFYYVGSDKKLYKLWWSSGPGWQTQVLNFPAGYPALTKANQKILFNADRIFYVGDSDGKIYNAIQSGVNWVGGGALSTAVVASYSTVYVDGSGKVFFVGNDQLIHNLVWISGWNDWVLHPDAPKVAITNEFTIKGDEIYYCSTANTWGPQIYCLYWDECSWKWNDLKRSNTDVKANSSLLFDSNNRLFYGNTSSTISYLVPPINESTHAYIYVKGKKLMDHGSPFEVKCINYLSEVYSTNTATTFTTTETLYIGPYQHYQTFANIGNPTSTGVADGITKVRADFAKMKSEGFNTIRLMGNFMAGLKDDDICVDENGNHTQVSDPSDTKIYFHKSVPTVSGSCVQWYSDIEYNANSKAKLFAVLDDLVYCAEQEQVKLILTTGFMNGDNPDAFDEYATYLSEVADHLKNKTAILAYDYWNEPNFLNYLVENNDKAVFCNATNSWYSAIRANAPNQLVTVGLYDGFAFTHNWDPAVLSADFIGFHSYPNKEPNDANFAEQQTRWDNSLSYISRVMYNLDKPWILEETSFIAGDDVNESGVADWGTEQDQENFALHMMTRVKNCGGAGWAWWQFRDVYWDYFGLIDHYGTDKLLINDPSLSNAAKSIFNSTVTQNCSCDPETTSYYNPFEKSGYTISGTVKDVSTGLGLKNAFIDGHGSTVAPPAPVNWAEYSMTISQDNGNFTITSNNLLMHWLNISAPGYEKVTIPYTSLSSCGTSCNIGTVYLTPVNCSETNYRLKNSEGSIGVKQVSNQLICKPNPNNGLFTVSLTDRSAIIDSYSIYNMQGVEVSKGVTYSNSLDINMGGHVSGVYYIRVKTGDTYITKKFVLL